MRLITTVATCVLAAGPLFAFCPPAHAEQNDLFGRAQQLLNNNSQSDQDAYARGRADERRREQAQQDRQYRHDNDQRSGNRDLSQERRYSDQDRDTYNYNRQP